MAIAPAGAEVVGLSPSILTARIHVADTTQRDAIADRLRGDSGIAAVTRNQLLWLDATDHVAAVPTTPNDPLYAFQAWHYGLIGLPSAWSLTTGSASILVAVVDQGIRFDHPALAVNLTSDGYDFVSSSAEPLCDGGTVDNDDDGDSGYDPDPTQPANYDFDPVMDCVTPDSIGAHGVHVAGTVGATGNDGIGVTGVNWTVRIRPVRVLGVTGAGTYYDVAQGILYAAGLPADNGTSGTVKASTGARVINLSLGGPSDDPTLHSAVIAASNAGVLLVVAAGNSSSSAPEYPAAYPEVLAVSAVGPNAALASYSNYGPNIGIAAPGGDFAAGDASDGVGSTMWNFSSSVPVYVFGTGTSMAAPHVTGVAALVLSLNPTLSAAQLRSRLTSYAVNIGPANLYGAGLLNAYNSLTQTFGPPTQVYARLYDAATGAIVQTVPVAGGAYVFSTLPDGNYDVYAGSDESGDQQLGIPGRIWGAFGLSARPSAVTIAGSGTYPASFSIGFPAEAKPNSTLATANTLVVGGYTHGNIVTPSTEVDAYRVQIPEAGTYSFETSGWIGACGLALEENTAIALYDSTGTVLTINDDIDAGHHNLCSRITATLRAGKYYVGVAGAYGRRYRLQARSGN